MEMLDKIIYKFIGWIDGLNQKINDVLTMDFTNFSKRNKKCKCGNKKTWNKVKTESLSVDIAHGVKKNY
ncbi:hypothetical protein [Pelagibacter phage HTVC010P]|uniref:hypothetical protein n=1 Tax=Pelagibacter phage HTVC010P TaxID=1283077 RepID=UPI0002B27666|nr:hypothetical protein I900_gp44 [Pelagibacter phage HTVC010P]AGE60314.1 hypothetical protein [Pelagibacter phage HTVC010P]